MSKCAELTIKVLNNQGSRRQNGWSARERLERLVRRYTYHVCISSTAVGRYRSALNLVIRGECREAQEKLASAWCKKHADYIHLQGPLELSRETSAETTPFISVGELLFDDCATIDFEGVL